VIGQLRVSHEVLLCGHLLTFGKLRNISMVIVLVGLVDVAVALQMVLSMEGWSATQNDAPPVSRRAIMPPRQKVSLLL
jgi:hypothetical protein